MKYTDQRAKTLLEVLGAMRVVKYFSYEVPFLTRKNLFSADGIQADEEMIRHSRASKERVERGRRNSHISVCQVSRVCASYVV